MDRTGNRRQGGNSLPRRKARQPAMSPQSTSSAPRRKSKGRGPAKRRTARPTSPPKGRSDCRAQSRAAAADGPTPVSRSDGVRLTLPKESRIGPTIVAHHHGPGAEMHHLHRVRMTRRGRRMVVIPPVRGRCCARGNERRALPGEQLGHDPSRRITAAPVNTLHPPVLPCSRNHRIGMGGLCQAERLLRRRPHQILTG